MHTKSDLCIMARKVSSRESNVCKCIIRLISFRLSTPLSLSFSLALLLFSLFLSFSARLIGVSAVFTWQASKGKLVKAFDHTHVHVFISHPYHSKGTRLVLTYLQKRAVKIFFSSYIFTDSLYGCSAL